VLDVTIREWREVDADALRPMVTAFLREAGAHGEPTPATPEMAEGLFQLGLHAASVGDPALVALRNGRPVGFVLCTAGLGVRGVVYTFVAPAERHQGIARQLRRRAFDLAAQCGYRVLFTLAYDGPWIEFEKSDGFVPLALLMKRDVPAPPPAAIAVDGIEHALH
jgi:GNAT superfamily N-acetyltransferase